MEVFHKFTIYLIPILTYFFVPNCFLFSTKFKNTLYNMLTVKYVKYLLSYLCMLIA